MRARRGARARGRRAGAGCSSRARRSSTRAKVNALKAVAEREAANPTPRVELANLYFDAERYDEAIKWYEEALKLNPEGRERQHRPGRLVLLHEPA